MYVCALAYTLYTLLFVCFTEPSHSAEYKVFLVHDLCISSHLTCFASRDLDLGFLHYYSCCIIIQFFILFTPLPACQRNGVISLTVSFQSLEKLFSGLQPRTSIEIFGPKKVHFPNLGCWFSNTSEVHTLGHVLLQTISIIAILCQQVLYSWRPYKLMTPIN